MAYIKSYGEYLKSPTYRAIRKCALRAACNVCQRCGLKATEVHHEKYPPIKWGEWAIWDVPSNLLVVCHQCHCKIEGKDE